MIDESSFPGTTARGHQAGVLAEKPPMKITDVRTLVVNAEMRNWVFVKVETDQDGLFGWGEASLEWKTRSVVGAVEDLAPMVVGEDPRWIEHLYQKMYRQSFWRLGVIGMSAISAIA